MASSPSASGRRLRCRSVPVACRSRAQPPMATDLLRPLAHRIASLAGRRETRLPFLVWPRGGPLAAPRVPTGGKALCEAVAVNSSLSYLNVMYNAFSIGVQQVSRGCRHGTTPPWTPGLADPCVLTAVPSPGRRCATCGRSSMAVRWVCTCELCYVRVTAGTADRCAALSTWECRIRQVVWSVYRVWPTGLALCEKQYQ